jgi:hypothetical protein
VSDCVVAVRPKNDILHLSQISVVIDNLINTMRDNLRTETSFKNYTLTPSQSI